MNAPKRFRKRPVVIEAWLLSDENAFEVASWCGGEAYQRYLFGEPQEMIVEIPTLEGVMEANRGDFIIKGSRGEFYPCKPTVFADVYEEA